MLKSLIRWICRKYASRITSQGDLHTTVKLWSMAIACGDSSPQTQRALGELYFQLGDYPRAIPLLESAAIHFNADDALATMVAQAHQQAVKPDSAEAHWNQSLALLAIGEFKRGWEQYEWRWATKDHAPRRDFTQPLWRGTEDLSGKTILLRSEDDEALGRFPELKYFGDQLGDFCDTATVVSLLDLAIAVGTSVAHLAGALGKLLWVMLPFAAGWRWLLEREDSPWYPSVRLFRQPQIGDWDTVIERMREELLHFTRSSNSCVVNSMRDANA